MVEVAWNLNVNRSSISANLVTDLFLEGDHIKVTASKYPFPTVCAEQQSTDWFHAISRTLKWNERERQKSFVVVEEDAPPRARKTKSRSVDASLAVLAPDEEEADDSEEEEKFDIDDSAPDAGFSSNGGTGMTDIGAIEKSMLLNRKRAKSRSHSRSRTRSSGSLSPGVMSPNRYATKPPHPRHVGFDVPSSPSSSSSESLVSDATREGPRDDVRSAYHHHHHHHPSTKSWIVKDREFDFEHVKTPTAAAAAAAGVHRARNVSQSEPRVFAVRGQDESDSATSDVDS
jgi:NAD+ kinase